MSGAIVPYQAQGLDLLKLACRVSLKHLGPVRYLALKFSSGRLKRKWMKKRGHHVPEGARLPQAEQCSEFLTLMFGGVKNTRRPVLCRSWQPMHRAHFWARWVRRLERAIEEEGLTPQVRFIILLGMVYPDLPDYAFLPFFKALQLGRPASDADLGTEGRQCAEIAKDFASLPPQYRTRGEIRTIASVVMVMSELANSNSNTFLVDDLVPRGFGAAPSILTNPTLRINLEWTTAGLPVGKGVKVLSEDRILTGCLCKVSNNPFNREFKLQAVTVEGLGFELVYWGTGIGHVLRGGQIESITIPHLVRNYHEGTTLGSR
jgi:hypothetical protein